MNKAHWRLKNAEWACPEILLYYSSCYSKSELLSFTNRLTLGRHKQEACILVPRFPLPRFPSPRPRNIT